MVVYVIGSVPLIGSLLLVVFQFRLFYPVYIESHKQFPFAVFNLPVRRFSPWQNAFDSACLSKFDTILLFVLILCTSMGVALLGSSVFRVMLLGFSLDVGFIYFTLCVTVRCYIIIPCY